jgi:heme-degrading monooxygenase HmoA
MANWASKTIVRSNYRAGAHGAGMINSPVWRQNPATERLMTIARVILINVAEGNSGDAERVWKEECAPLMQRQVGCRSEKLMRSLDRPDLYISYAEWESMEDVERYRSGTDHKTIQSEVRDLDGARAVVWCYEILD